MVFYTSIIKNSKIGETSRFGEGAPMPAGTVMTASFQLEGQPFVALNGRPDFPFTEAISFYVDCETQEEIDELWEKLTSGGEESPCGWLKDKFGGSWQIIPKKLIKLLNDPDPQKAGRVRQAMLKMKKIDVEKLHQAYENR